jgi:hypothetical protein
MRGIVTPQAACHPLAAAESAPTASRNRYEARAAFGRLSDVVGPIVGRGAELAIRYGPQRDTRPTPSTTRCSRWSDEREVCPIAP